jgi:hypothetical protein
MSMVTIAHFRTNPYLGPFKPAQIMALEASITMKDTGKTPTPYVTCLVRGKPIKLTPEEAVRQLFVMVCLKTTSVIQ